MTPREKIFHDSWYRISGEKISLRSSVNIHKQMFRGNLWYVLHDPFTNQFFRFPPEVYEFIARMNGRKTIEEIWNDLLSVSPETAPTQSNIIELLSQLYQSNLIHSNLAPDSIRLFERYEKREKKKIQMTLMNLLFARIPVFDPDNLLKKLKPLINLIFSPVGIIFWFVMVAFGIKSVIDNFTLIVQQSEGIIAPSNLFLLYIGTIIVKLIHEFGHGAAVRRFGGEVHTLGIMLMMLTPLPYVDATSAWAFRNKWKRILVGASGVLFELVVASISIIVWANTGDGIIHSLAYNMAFIASISSLVFNCNPLLKYDGYYMLSDFVSIPNLQQQGQKESIYYIEKYLFGKKDGVSLTNSNRESLFIVVYNFLSTIYRIIVFGGIILFMSSRYLLLALFMSFYLLVTWLFVPLVKGVKYLFTSPSISRNRGKAIRVSIAIGIAVFVFFTMIPFPLTFKSPGVLKAKEFTLVSNATAGVVKKIEAVSGMMVQKGDTLFRLDNRELELEKKELLGKINEINANYRLALSKSPSQLKQLSTKRNVLREKVAHADSQLINLVIKAPISGHWYSPNALSLKDRWIPKGTSVGQIINSDDFYFASAVVQDEIGQLVSRDLENSGIRLKGQSSVELSVDNMIIIPMEQINLPSSALGFMGGGDIAVKTGDSSGTVAKEPFYEVRAEVKEEENVRLLHGRTGEIRFSLGNQPLLFQLFRKLRQVIQKNYRV